MLKIILVVLSPSMGSAETNPQALTHLVHQDCGSCHGLQLKGGLGPALLPETLSHYTVNTLSPIILDGIEGTAMPPWRSLLSQEEADWIAQYLLEGPKK